MVKKILSIVVAVIAVVIIVLGISLISTDPVGASYSGDFGHYDAESAAFGADFYTYMYNASDIIVSELNDIGNNLPEIIAAQNGAIKATNNLNETVAKAGGMVVIAIGLAVLAYSVKGIVDAFIPCCKKQAAEDIPA